MLGTTHVRTRPAHAAILAALVLLTGCALAAPDWRDVRLVKDSAAVEGCTLLTILRDEDMNDLRRRAAESGGDTVLLTGTTRDNVPIFGRERFVADVYRCYPAGNVRRGPA
jgi:hypothetical protein